MENPDPQADSFRWADGHVPKPVGYVPLDDWQNSVLSALVASNYHIRVCTCGELISSMTLRGLRDSYIEHLADIESGEDLHYGT